MSEDLRRFAVRFLSDEEIPIGAISLMAAQDEQTLRDRLEQSGFQSYEFVALNLSGGSLAIRYIDTNATAEPGQWIVADPTAGNLTVTLPDAVDAGDERVRVTIKQQYAGVNTVTVQGVVLRIPGAGVEWQSDGTNWVKRPL